MSRIIRCRYADDVVESACDKAKRVGLACRFFKASGGDRMNRRLRLNGPMGVGADQF